MPAAGRVFSPVPARRNRSSISSTPRWRRSLNGRKPPSVSWRLASWRNGTHQPSLLPSSPSKARNGVKSFERPGLRRSEGLHRARLLALRTSRFCQESITALTAGGEDGIHRKLQRSLLARRHSASGPRALFRLAARDLRGHASGAARDRSLRSRLSWWAALPLRAQRALSQLL